MSLLRAPPAPRLRRGVAAALTALACAGAPPRPLLVEPPSGVASPVRIVRQDAKDQRPMDADGMRMQLRDLEARGRRGEAGKALGEWSDRAKETGSLDARFLAATALPDLEARWDALHALTQETSAYPWAHYGKAVVYAAWNLPDRVEAELALASRDAGLRGLAETLRGDLARALGDEDGAVTHYVRALALDPKDAEARTGRAFANRARRQADDFEAELKQSLSDLPTHAPAAEALAELYDESNRPEAKDAWTVVARLVPQHRAARLALARLAGTEDPQGAITAYEEAGKLEPLTKAQLTVLARLYLGVRDPEREKRTLEQLVKLDPMDAAAWRRIAAIVEDRGEWKEAEAAWSAVRGADEGAADAWLALARLAERQEKLPKAVALLSEAKKRRVHGATEELARLRTACGVAGKPVTGTDMTALYRAVSAGLDQLRETRLPTSPELKGRLKVRIVLDGLRAKQVDVVENTTKDPFLEAHLQLVLSEATWPKPKSGDGKRFTLAFDVPSAPEEKP
jgi:tetratricopeptide (TPR) repeat protein